MKEGRDEAATVEVLYTPKSRLAGGPMRGCCSGATRLARKFRAARVTRRGPITPLRALFLPVRSGPEPWALRSPGRDGGAGQGQGTIA